MKALAKATAMSLEGYVINMSWLTLEPNVRYPQTPDPAHTETTLQVSTVANKRSAAARQIVDLRFRRGVGLRVSGYVTALGSKQELRVLLPELVNT